MFSYELHYESGKTESLTYDEALNIILGYYKDNDMTRDMLQVVNRIVLKPIGYLNVYEEDVWEKFALMPGCYNNLPNGFNYDDNENHLN